jgi:hypothetical protein
MKRGKIMKKTINNINIEYEEMNELPSTPWNKNIPFPKEIWFFKIIPHLSIFEKVRLSRTCWSFRLLIKNEKDLIRYNSFPKNSKIILDDIF